MASSPLSRSPLSAQVSALRATLLLSLGLSPLACGGSVVTASNGDGGRSAQAEGGVSSSDGGVSPSGGASPVRGCENPTIDPVTKLTHCSNGLRHRAQASACTYINPPPPSEAGGASGDGGAGGQAENANIYCSSHAECQSLLRGYCDSDLVYAQCRSGCLTDSDCDGAVCACDGYYPGRCTTGDCRTDADCGANAYCAPVPEVCGQITYHCITLVDQCAEDADCKQAGLVCGPQNGRNICVPGAACGRPFLIANAPRMAALETRADWLDTALLPNVSALIAIQRASLAAHWARLGQMEHASIAAFARFNLQLLSLGAPSDLVEACNRALADETAHARTCFALASAYGGTAVGPARIDIERCFEDTNLTAIAKLVLREGCLGETVASLEAAAAAEAASDPAVKQALTRIVRDELSHAELAFKFLRWALEYSSPEARHELACEAERQLADFERDAGSVEPTQSDEQLAAHGQLGSDARRAIQLAAARDVARPLLAALFDVALPSAAA